MEKPYYKAILLVFASANTPLYNAFKKIYETYMFEEPSIKVLFTYNANKDFVPNEYDLVYDDLKETHYPPHSTKKVTRAITHIHEHYTYDYLIRTNLSTFWVFDRLLAQLETLPTKQCFAGKVGTTKDFVTGTNMIISSDLIEPLLEQQHLINNRIYTKYAAEDKLLSDLITHQLAIPIISTLSNMCLIENLVEYNEAQVKSIIRNMPNASTFRIKNFRGDRLAIDIPVMQLLLRTFYNRNVDSFIMEK